MIEKKLNREIIPIGCSAHIIHNALSTAVSKVIPIDLETIIIKIYYHFKDSTTRVETLKEFCEFVGVTMQSILRHTETRWLSLAPCVERLLKLWSALKSYFLSEANVPLLLYNFFNSDVSEFWTLFVHPQLQLCTDTMAKIQRSDFTAVEMSFEYKSLLKKFTDRFESSLTKFYH
jgi:hypothetical protein